MNKQMTGFTTGILIRKLTSSNASHISELHLPYPEKMGTSELPSGLPRALESCTYDNMCESF